MIPKPSAASTLPLSPPLNNKRSETVPAGSNFQRTSRSKYQSVETYSSRCDVRVTYQFVFGWKLLLASTASELLEHLPHPLILSPIEFENGDTADAEVTCELHLLRD